MYVPNLNMALLKHQKLGQNLLRYSEQTAVHKGVYVFVTCMHTYIYVTHNKLQIPGYSCIMYICSDIHIHKHACIKTCATVI